MESLYYHPEIVNRIAQWQAKAFDCNPNELLQIALTAGVAAVKANRNHFVEDAAHRLATRMIRNCLPDKQDIKNKRPINVEVDTPRLYQDEEKRFDALVSGNDWDGLLMRYNLRQSQAFDNVASSLKLKNRGDYEAMALTRLQNGPSAVEALRNLFAGLCTEASG